MLMTAHQTFADVIAQRELDDEQWEPTELRSMADALPLALAPRVRFPIVRTGVRELLPKWLAVAVLKRDGFACTFCDQLGGYLEIDHQIPWSAGGPDKSWNLRALCHYCNQAKSNYASHGHDRNTLPIVSRCAECEGKRRGIGTYPGTDWGEWIDEFDGDHDRHTVWCDRCQWFSAAPVWRIDGDPFNNPERWPL